MTKVQIIINPASGAERPVLKILNKAFGNEMDWDISITHKRGDAHEFALKALAEGADIVAALGGDGTVTEVASALVGSDTPLAILPGGTGNSIARTLNIPIKLEESTMLLKQDFCLRPVDLGRVNDHTFMLRIDIGYTAVAGAETDRESKDSLGVWAYALAGAKNLDKLNPIPYHLNLDGEEVEVPGVICMVINVGSVEFGHRPFAKGIAPDDGLLDIFVLSRNDLVALGEVASSVVLGNPTPMHHWRVRSATIQPDPDQTMLIDGDPIEDSPANIQVLPKAVKVIVPSDK